MQVETTIIDVIEEPAPGVVVVTEYEFVQTAPPTSAGSEPEGGEDSGPGMPEKSSLQMLDRVVGVEVQTGVASDRLWRLPSWLSQRGQQRGFNPAYRADEFHFYLSDLEAKALVVEAGSTSPSAGGRPRPRYHDRHAHACAVAGCCRHHGLILLRRGRPPRSGWCAD